jgi:hypothetical protein
MGEQGTGNREIEELEAGSSRSDCGGLVDWAFVKEMRNRETLGQLLRIGVRYLSWIGGRD